MKSQTALVRTDCVVELNTVSSVDMSLTVIVNPGNSENNLSVGFGYSFKNSVSSVLFLMLCNNGAQRIENFFDSLKKFGLILKSFGYLRKYFVNITHVVFLLTH